MSWALCSWTGATSSLRDTWLLLQLHFQAAQSMCNRSNTSRKSMKYWVPQIAVHFCVRTAIPTHIRVFISYALKKNVSVQNMRLSRSVRPITYNLPDTRLTSWWPGQKQKRSTTAQQFDPKYVGHSAFP